MAEVHHAFRSVFDQPDERKIGRAFVVSMALHGGFVALIAWWMFAPAAPIQPPPPESYKVVFLEAPGPGGGGGGSPAPARPRKVEVPKSTPAVTPVTPQPVPVTPPPPELMAPVQTNVAELMQSTGISALALAAPAGGNGRGRGLGPGDGDGVGPGKTKGFGDGAYQPGSGIEDPKVITPVQPTYTSEAMRAKIQGVVWLDAVVLADGTIGDVRVARSLDRAFGLDQKAIDAARLWRFRPAMRPDPITKQRTPVAIVVRLELEFRLH